MLLETTARDLLLVSWDVDPEAVGRALPAGLEPALLEGGAGLVSLVALRNVDVRVGGRRLPPYGQITVRTYVTRGEEPAVFFLSLRVGWAGLAGALVGVPVRPARIRVAEGAVLAPGLGVRCRYRVCATPPDVPAPAGSALGTHDAAYLLSAGLRRLRADYEPFAWEAAELLETPRADPLLALGFEAHEPSSALYARSTAFRLELPPERVAS